MTTEWSFEKLFDGLGLMRMGFGIVFSLFLLLFVAVFVEEVFLGGRKRRKAEKQARLARDAAARPED
ncbi:MAG: hypothetical protein IPQ16_02805 [Geobacteraceae bacterium]|nr:hypothetical protein [Geobacteraceae bacterium]